jgi:hypothetical protein
MKLMKILLSTLGVATLAFTISSCSSGAANSSGNTTANTANKNTAIVVNNNQTANTNAAPAANAKLANANTAKPAASTAKATPADSESENVSGELTVGKTESVILYVGMETGDYAAYCFTNASEVGRAILAKCKNKDQCEVTATLGDGGGSCKVSGLEATLSAEFRILKVNTIKSLGRRK